MLQVAVSGGEVKVVEVPEPALRPGGVLVRTSHSVISVGTESAGLGSGGGRESLLLRALRNPHLVRKVMDRVASRGLRSTVELVRSRVTGEQAVGYSCAGVVADVAPDVARFRPGDRVACGGAGYANHAAVNAVPANLLARLPDGVSFPEGAFATLAAIALQGVRRATPVLGDRVAVIGLGLIGQLTAQLLRSSGAVVTGVDVRADRVERARALGMASGFAIGERDLVDGILERTEGRGADAVIVTAAGGDAALLNRSFEACRRKGRVVLVGDVPIRIQRDRIYAKELDFLISTSSGPGRYDPEYEERGIDYPFAYVRWTEGRNLEEVVRRMESGELNVRALIDRVHPVGDALAAYQALTSAERPVGVLLDYELDASVRPPALRRYVARRAPASPAAGRIRVGAIGFGNYFRGVLLPLLKARPEIALASVCTPNGLRVRGAVEKDGFGTGTTDWRELVRDPDIDAVFITTRHNQHCLMARAAVEAGKAVFVEKPMTMTSREGRDLADLVAERQALLTVGFNRRFSPHAVRMRELLGPVAGPKTMVYRVSAGVLPADHWLLEPTEGGGRLLGEGVHYFDFLAFACGSAPVRVEAVSPPGKAFDEAIVTIEFEDGSVATLVYSGAGAATAPKERLEIFAGGVTLVLDDFRGLEVHGLRGSGTRTRHVEKGQKEQLANFVAALRGQQDLGVTAEDGWRATWCAEQARAGGRDH